ncbi:polynucleotide adenylyltransferase PcnB [Litorivicinus sp.]|nr:polynucleotide adenylyltransferase PcnB [Litorivicinus sp.]
MFSVFRKIKQGTEIQISRNVISQEYHGLQHSDLSAGSLRVIEILQKAGFQAYLVGGGIRDLLLEKHPKDFDVATNARPNEIQSLFRKARIIGRRFQIVHVRMGPEIIEVTTFRGSSENSHHRQANESGMLVRDNVFGSVEDDAIRRDFTMNALYYDPTTHEVLDFVGGYDDLEDNIIRVIGDPETRYREDPVRMLRAVRFVGKLGMSLAEETKEPIKRLASLLRDVSSSRLFDEVLKLLQAGNGYNTFPHLLQFELLRSMFPQAHTIFQANNDNSDHRLILKALQNTDSRLSEGKTVTPAFLYAAMHWPQVHLRWLELEREGNERSNSLAIAASETLEFNQQFVAIPKRFSTTIREIWDLQIKLEKRHGRRPDSTLEHPRFRAGYDFLLLRESAGEIPVGLGQWWTEYQIADETERRELITSVQGEEHGAMPKRRPRKRAGPKPNVY